MLLLLLSFLRNRLSSKSKITSIRVSYNSFLLRSRFIRALNINSKLQMRWMNYHLVLMWF